MRRALFRRIVLLIALVALYATHADAEVRVVRLPAPDEGVLEIVSDDPPWKLRYYVGLGAVGVGEYKLTPVSADRILFVRGLLLHLIDAKNGVVLNRWMFPDKIEDVRVDGDRFHVRTVRIDDRYTTTITADSPAPAIWIDSLLYYRMAVLEGGVFDKAVGLEPRYEKTAGQESTPVPRQPLATSDAERLIVEVEEAIRRDPFSPQLGVCLALLMRDLGRKDAEAAFRRAIERPTNFYGELFMIAGNLENGRQADWATLAFNQAYARLWQQGADPRLIFGLLPRLMLSYLPYELRTGISDDRRAELMERLYLMAPYVEQSPEAWRQLAAYFDLRSDSKSAALWRARANEADLKSGYVWELIFYLERTTRILVALFLSVLAYYVILQRRYAPQRRLIRGDKSWWRGLLGLSPFSMTCWDRQDRRALYGLLALFWLASGLWGALGQGSLRTYSAPTATSSGSLRAPVTEKYLRDLPPTRDRDLLMAISLQQAEKEAEAEALFKTLPDSAAKWNNLGVLQAKQGKADQAKESFEHALRLDPQAVEPAFNLDRPVSDPWAQMHSKYRPGQKMLVPPSHAEFYRAIRGSIPSLAAQSLQGPTLSLRVYEDVAAEVFSYGASYNYLKEEFLSLFLAGPLIFAVLAAIALFASYREVTQAPGRLHWLIEMVFPGTARQWGRAGGLFLAVAIWGILEFLSKDSFWTPFEISWGIERSFGLPPGFNRVAASIWPSDPGWFWNYGIVSVAILLFLANAIVVIRTQLRLRRPQT